ncbi:phosphotransferase family protein [Profundibacterium mesophilum]|uniref:Acyl-CoA dehydrogenase n=1 Tax=Profundibacterium mesophilum KAUST100406-0324 TaxID=1037889 RepID=A0A921NQS6_9RHOB|nr:phosphotransferase family protein [Profundibacterium mesophilum]KAF0677196.1 acyl-CoA dehydrogenase [Profundibacterium mesophilum KAUST100406-0324]
MSSLDETALRAWLERHFPQGGPDMAATPIDGGQSNPTYFLDWGEMRMVLRRKPLGPILPGAHAVEREYRVMDALAGTALPVPRMLRLEEEPSVLGAPFYVMERLEGRVFSDCALPGLDPDERRGMYLSMARTLAALHALRPDEIGLGDYGRPGNYFERQIGRWSKQYRQSEGPRIAALDTLAEWLPANMPPDDGASAIAHGDFRLGNMMFHPTEPRVIAVLDWELSTLGHPLADLGFCVMPWQTLPEEYGGILGLDREALGIPSKEEFVAEYYAHARPTPPLGAFHEAFALFRFAVIFVGIADRARAGNAASSEAEELGPLAERFARRALEAAGLAPRPQGEAS